MSLTGPLFLGTVVAVTIAAFVLLVVAWPRLTGRSPWRIAGRVGALLLVNVLVLLTAATQLNASFLFFAGWGDLHSAISGDIAQTSLDRGGAAEAAGRVKPQGTAVVASRQVPPLSVPVDASGLATFEVHGAASGLTGKVLVQLPPGYGDAANATTRYPVLEAFHGYPSEPLNWIKIFHIDQALEHQERDGTIAPTLVVMPQVEIPGGVDTEGVNGSPGRPQLETWLTQDVPAWVAQTFRVRSDRNSWATIGYSAGGWTAAMATVLHPAQYGAAIVMGGYFRPEFGPFYDPYPRTSPLERRYDLPRLVRHHAVPVAMWVETSHADAISYTSSASFLKSVRAPMAVHAVVLQNAGHRDSVWIALMPQALRWLGAHVSGFRPRAQ